MKNKIKHLHSPWFRYVATSVSLFFLWIILTAWYILVFDQSLLILSYPHSEKDFTIITHNKLLKSQKISGEVVAAENNLGIISIRFKSFPRVQYKDEDSLLFHIKEKGQKNWYYENKYRSGFIYDMPFLPFGIPIIHDSKGKTYIFELVSLKGNQHNGVALSTRQPFLVSKYQGDKALLLADHKALFIFGLTKFFNSFQTIDIAYSSFVFALAFFFYLFIISPIRNFLSKYVLPLFLVGVILIDILFLQILNDLLFIFPILLWFYIMKQYKYDSIYSFGVGALFFILMPVSLYLNDTGISQQAGAFAFLFFVAGTIQEMTELKRNV